MVGVWVDPSEHQWLVRQAKKAGVSKGRYLRQVTLGILPQAPVPFATNQRSLDLSGKVTHQELKDVIFKQLPELGENLSDVKRRVNSKEVFEEKYQQAMIEEITQIRQETSRAITIITEAIL